MDGSQGHRGFVSNVEAVWQGNSLPEDAHTLACSLSESV